MFEGAGVRSWYACGGAVWMPWAEGGGGIVEPLAVMVAISVELDVPSGESSYTDEKSWKSVRWHISDSVDAGMMSMGFTVAEFGIPRMNAEEGSNASPPKCCGIPWDMPAIGSRPWCADAEAW
jgi:hypothetical protein